MKKTRIVVTRQVTETWHYDIDTQELERHGVRPINELVKDPGAFGDACDVIHVLVNGELEGELIESNCSEESIVEWGEVDLPEKKRGGFSC